MTASRIVSTGFYQPARVLTNDELTTMVDTSDEWIRSRVGIRERRVAADDESVAEMATSAAKDAMAGAGIAAADVDLIVVGTCTAETRSPNTACQVADQLGITALTAYDLNTACSGFNYALATADHAIRAGAAQRAIVVGAEKLSAFTDWSDRTTCVLVGDGAGAVVLEATDGEPGVYPGICGSVPGMGDAVVIDGDPAHFHQQGQAVFRWAVTALPELARQVCEVAGFKPGDLAGFVPHQANLRIIEPLAATLGLRPDAVVARDVVESGNTSAASVPLAFAKLVARGELPSGVPVLLMGFGGGLTYAGQVVRTP